MAADVLLYNALNEINIGLQSRSAELDTLLATKNSICSALESQVSASALIANAGPNQANLWCLIPTLPATGCAWTSDFKVCDTTNYKRSGACCAWTVPGGATCARFQLWGAGAGTGGSCCCGFAPFGGTGAYASVIIPVTPGCVYTLCAGCAFCCYSCGGTNNVDGCPSFVTGFGLTNFCAEGGEGSIYCEVLTRCQFAAFNPDGCRCTYLGGSICNSGSDVCWCCANGQSGTGCNFGYNQGNFYPPISSCKTFYGSATSGSVFGIRGSFGYIRVCNYGQICAIHPPIYGFASTSCCAVCLTTCVCTGVLGSACCGVLVVPGAGGWPTFKCGGQTTTPPGDAGRLGMVCVSFR